MYFSLSFENVYMLALLAWIPIYDQPNLGISSLEHRHLCCFILITITTHSVLNFSLSLEVYD
jgi:hypothetical protein